MKNASSQSSDLLTLAGWGMDAVPGVGFSQAAESVVSMVSLKIGIGSSGSTLLVETVKMR